MSSIGLTPGQTQVIQNQKVLVAHGNLVATNNDGESDELKAHEPKDCIGEWTLAALTSTRLSLEPIDRVDVERPKKKKRGKK